MLLPRNQTRIRIMLVIVVATAVFCEESIALVITQPSPGEFSRNTSSVPSILKDRSFTNGTGRFLFDQIFGFAGGDDDDDDDDSSDAKVKNCTCECGVTNQENRIVGGRPTGVNRYPWVARIVYDGHFHCGASLLTSEYVLTAAHCVRRLKRSKIRVVLGDHDQFVTTDAPAKMRMVASIIRHRNFDANSYNHDIALLRLRKPIEFSKNIRPVCLPFSADDPSGREGTVVGWGRTAEGGVLPNVVQEVQVPIWSLAQCRAMKYRASRITGYMLCAGKGAQDSCQGDSGGPLLVHSGDKYEIVGELKRSKIRVVLGDHDQFVTTDAPAKMRMVASIIRHRNFDANSYNHDIALLRLRKPIEFSKNIRPVCLPFSADDPSGREGTVVGWGRTAEGGVLPNVVQEVQVPIWSLAQCRAMKYRASRITGYMLCAGKGAQDSCQGDSGGPLLVHSGDKYEIVGIVSWGVGCGRPGYPGVYTRVSRYLNWVRSNMEDTCLCVN